MRMDKKIDWTKLNRIVKEILKNDKSGHDYAHSIRVLKNAEEIVKSYRGTDLEVLTAACLLHDIAFKDGWVQNHHIIGAEQTPYFLEQVNFPYAKIKKVQIVIEDHVGQMVKPIRKNYELSIESKILRDADNIDALGSIGLIRMISFCAANNIPYFKLLNDGWDDSVYGGVKSLLSWADKMLTPEGKEIGESRLPVMRDFLKQLEKEHLS